jgi:elongator complex protein 1
MRNLCNIRFGSLGDIPDVSAACWDPERDEVLCTVGPVGESGKIELVRVTDGNVV